MKKYIYFAVIFFLISMCAFAQKNDDYRSYVRRIEALVDEYSRAMEFQKLQESEFQEFLRQDRLAYQRYVEEIERKWNEFIGSTPQKWVDYSEDKNVRSIVDFSEEASVDLGMNPLPSIQNSRMTTLEGVPFYPLLTYLDAHQMMFTAVKEAPKGDGKGGLVTVEAIVPAVSANATGKAKEMIGNQVEKLLSDQNEAKVNILKDQIKNKLGEVVTTENVKEFVKDEVLTKTQTASKKIRSKDGVERIKVSVSIPMVPNHIKVRAEQYVTTVKKYCDQFKEDFALVMAIVQTESYFNPLAKSPTPEYGLMLLSPELEAKEAYKEIFKKDSELEPSYLYVPNNNLLLGIAYLRLLRDKYFYGIEDPVKQEYLVIGAYDAGIKPVVKDVLKKHDISKMTPSEVYKVLEKEMPDETRDYLAKVTSRKKTYIASLQISIDTAKITSDQLWQMVKLRDKPFLCESIGTSN